MKNSFYFILALCFSFIACQNKTKTSGQDKEPAEMIATLALNDTSDKRHLENISEVNRKRYQFELTEHTDAYDNLVYKYWENLSDEERAMVLKSKTVPEEVIQLYRNQFILSDDEPTFNLLEELTSTVHSDETIKALYFYLFNKIMQFSDGALAEVMGEYGINIFILDIPYALEYFTVNDEVMEKYGDHLGVEFYFNLNGRSGFLYTFSEFKDKIKTDLKGSDKYDELLSTFYEVIENMMKRMD